jgi:hypothetical protein
MSSDITSACFSCHNPRCIQYLVQQTARVIMSDCHFLIPLLRISAAIGNLQEGHLQRTTFIINSLKDMHI